MELPANQEALGCSLTEPEQAKNIPRFFHLEAVLSVPQIHMHPVEYHVLLLYPFLPLTPMGLKYIQVASFIGGLPCTDAP